MEHTITGDPWGEEEEEQGVAVAVAAAVQRIGGVFLRAHRLLLLAHWLRTDFYIFSLSLVLLSPSSSLSSFFFPFADRRRQVRCVALTLAHLAAKRSLLRRQCPRLCLHL